MRPEVRRDAQNSLFRPSGHWGMVPEYCVATSRGSVDNAPCGEAKASRVWQPAKPFSRDSYAFARTR